LAISQSLAGDIDEELELIDPQLSQTLKLPVPQSPSLPVSQSPRPLKIVTRFAPLSPRQVVARIVTVSEEGSLSIAKHP
jgi:hypothetical protein